MGALSELIAISRVAFMAWRVTLILRLDHNGAPGRVSRGRRRLLSARQGRRTATTAMSTQSLPFGVLLLDLRHTGVVVRSIMRLITSLTRAQQ